MNKHEVKMLAAITAENDKGRFSASPGRLAPEFAALDKLCTKGAIRWVPECRDMKTGRSFRGWVVAEHPLASSSVVNAAACRALSDAESRLKSAQYDVDALNKFLGKNV